MSSRSEFVAGVKAGLPILLGVAPFGMIYGVLAVSAGLPAGVAQAMSAIVFAGSAQFVAARLLMLGAPGVIIILTTLIVNLRHVLYSASLAPHLRHLNWRWKGLLAFLLTDEAYAIAIMHYGSPRDAPAASSAHDVCGRHVRSSHAPAGACYTQRHWYFLGAGLSVWLIWQASTAIGIVLGTQIPASWALDFALPLTFIALVVPALKDWPSVAAALTAGTVAVLAAGWPYKLGLIAAALSGIGMGLLLEAWRAPASRPVQERTS